MYTATEYQRHTVHSTNPIVVEPFSNKVIRRKTRVGFEGDDLLVENYGWVDILPTTIKREKTMAIIIRNESEERLFIPPGTALCVVSTISPVEGAGKQTIIRQAGIEEVEAWQPSKVIKIENDKLSEEQTQKLKDLVDEFKQIFSKNDEDIGKAKFENEIDVDTALLKPGRKFSVAYGERQTVEQHLEKMLKAKVIQRSEGAYTSPVVLVGKPDGSKSISEG